MFTFGRFARRRQDIADIEAHVLSRRIEEGLARDKLEKAIEAHRRQYNPSALARSLRWGNKDDD